MRMFFVDPDLQGYGIGSQLIGHVHDAARKADITCLEVQSSIGAEEFYRKHGFIPVRHIHDRGQRTILMKKPIGPASHDAAAEMRIRLGASMRQRSTVLSQV